MYLLILVVSNISANVENYNVFVNIFVETIIAFEETGLTHLGFNIKSLFCYFLLNYDSTC